MLRATLVAVVVSLAPLAATPAERGLSAAAVFASDGIVDVQLSPGGEWLLARAVRGRTHGLLLQGRGLDGTLSTFATNDPIVEIAWSGPRTYLAEASTPLGPTLLIGRLVDRSGSTVVEHAKVTAPGQLVDPLPLVDDVVIWRIDTRRRSFLHRAELNELETFRERSNPLEGGIYRIGDVIAATKPWALEWIVDRRGEPRVALRQDEEGHELLSQPPGRGRLFELRRFGLDPREEVDPVALSKDGSRIIVRTFADGSTRGLHAMDAGSGEIVEAIYVHEERDVVDVVVDRLTGELIAAKVLEDGEGRLHYFDAVATRHLATLRSRFPEDELVVVSTDVSGGAVVFRTSGPDDPGTYRLFDATTGIVTPIAEASTSLRDAELVDVTAFTVTSRDGTPVEALLALPRRIPAGGAPLVVRPHGGPIDVHDERGFDPLGQYLASWGYAVLQVNYRGSAGYGLEFLEAGFQQWGRGIEDDIDAAVEETVRRPEIDASRVCIEGGSYGGFSAVSSVIRYPQRYRCAATLNGVSDLLLMFQESDCSDWDPCHAAWKRIIGDPTDDRAALIASSPSRHVAEIPAPILIAYGTEDRRVDPDHAHRLIAMLELHDKPHEVLEITGAGHSPSRTEWVIYARVLRRFLAAHLEPGEDFVEDPEDTDRRRALSSEVLILSE